ncbi:hypothetical protein J4558_26900 [Leptolyngbya sp. 15MV]|nr:hypothetical protein J4558_26900 [Leptolyngbya sp. 15MV]
MNLAWGLATQGAAPMPAQRILIVLVHDLDGPLDLAAWHLPIPHLPRENWQIPFDERLLTSEGWVRWALDGQLNPPASGRMRRCFWLYMIAAGPLLTPFGAVSVPPSTKLPAHLAHLEFEPP